MSRKVFYSFHYERDAWRAAQVRNSNLLADEDEYGVIDSVEWEKVQRQGNDAIKRWINDQLKYTSVTVVLIGAETAERPWVEHEIRKSWERGNALVAVRIHSIKDQNQRTDSPGPNPFDRTRFTDGTSLSSVCKTYDWVIHDGRTNLGEWVEDAFQARTALTEPKEIADDGVERKMNVSAVAGPTIIHNPTGPWAC